MVWDRDDEKRAQKIGSALVISQSHIPPYGMRKGWVPRKEDDFGSEYTLM